MHFCHPSILFACILQMLRKNSGRTGKRIFGYALNIIVKDLTMTFKHLYAPWRADYAQKTKQHPSSNKHAHECVFCTQIAAQDDERYFILKRYEHCVIFLNLYPYNAGHLLVVPYMHVAHLEDLSTQARAEMMEVISYAAHTLTQVLKAEGHNIGFNVGKIAGAGIPEHLHGHILPRWHGDTNFMPLLMGTKQISVDLHETYKKLKAEWK